MSLAKMTTARAAIVTIAVLGLAACGSAVGSEGSTKSTAPQPTLIRGGTLTVCSQYPTQPFEFEQGGKVVGFDADLVGEVAKELGVKVSYTNEDFADIQSGKVLNANFCDIGVAAISITGDRARVVDFSSPYFNASQVLVTQQGSGVKSLGDASGAKIGVQEGTTGATYAADYAPPDTQIVKFTSVEEVNIALSGDTIDAGIYDNNLVGEAVTANPNFQVIETYKTGEQYGMAVKKDGDVDLLRVINQVLADIQESGRYDEIYQEWFGKSAE